MCGVRREAEVAADVAAAPACARGTGGTERTMSSPRTGVHVHRAERESLDPHTTHRTGAVYGTPPAPQRVDMSRAVPAGSAQTPEAACAAAAAGARPDEGSLRCGCSPAPPGGEWPASAPPPPPVWLAPLPSVSAPRGLWTPRPLLSWLPTTVPCASSCAPTV